VWLDVSDPSLEELEGLARQYHLHPTLVADCMQPLHLPKHQKSGDGTFVLVRAVDEGAPEHADTAQSLSHKVACFIGDGFLITIHRADPSFLAAIRAEYRETERPVYLQVLMLEILLAAVETYHRPLEDAEVRLHQFEAAVLRNREDEGHWELVFRTQARLTMIKRLLWHTLNAVQKFVPHSEMNQPLCQDLRERIESLSFFSENLLDDLRNLLSIQLSLSTKGTNDVIRTLTLFSVFFMPLTFLVGVYGMNFVHMPELAWRFGYAGAWLLMMVTGGVIVWWFRKRRWL
jgi:magnesium transporter